MILIFADDRIELRHEPPNPARPVPGELVALALPLGERWSVLEYDGAGERIDVPDRRAAEDLLIERMRR